MTPAVSVAVRGGRRRGVGRSVTGSEAAHRVVGVPRAGRGRGSREVVAERCLRRRGVGRPGSRPRRRRRVGRPARAPTVRRISRAGRTLLRRSARGGREACGTLRIAPRLRAVIGPRGRGTGLLVVDAHWFLLGPWPLQSNGSHPTWLVWATTDPPLGFACELRAHCARPPATMPAVILTIRPPDPGSGFPAAHRSSVPPDRFRARIRGDITSVIIPRPGRPRACARR